ncbi:hypothetical protein KCV26_15940 [Petrimonas sulfuriphila]|uniref:hypothetical protein n=1 Tax=Petrimonas sulfuriphila TaxID=285070 RepID=UPI0032457D24
MEKIIGINQRISINVMEMAIKACLDGSFTPEYAADLAAGEYQGANRINKARSIIGKLTQRNPLYPFIEEHKQEYLTSIKYTGDRAIIYAALINAAYGFGYDAMVILGKFFHVQEQVFTGLIMNHMSLMYASNRSLSNGLYCIMPMYIEAGLISRKKVGVYTKKDNSIVTSFARDLYIKSFFVNNPMLEESNHDYADHPYFEFI